MISKAFGTLTPIAGNWNCSAVAAPKNRQASTVRPTFQLPKITAASAR